MDTSAPVNCASNGLPALTWIVAHADYVGLALIIVMLVLVAWRAATKQVAAPSEVAIGLIGTIVLLLPVINQFSFEGLGVKASASIRQTQCDLSTDVVDLKRRVQLLEGKALTPQAMTGLDGGSHTEAFAPKDVATLIYYLDTANRSRRTDALRVQALLAKAGYQSSLFATDFSEINRSGADTIKIFYGKKGIDFAGDVEKLLKSSFDEQVISIDQVSSISSGDIQIQVY